MAGTNNRRMALDSRTICQKTEAKLLKWLERITEESHWTVELSAKKTEAKLLKWLEQITEESHWTVELSAKKQKQNY